MTGVLTCCDVVSGAPANHNPTTPADNTPAVSAAPATVRVTVGAEPGWPVPTEARCRAMVGVVCGHDGFPVL